MRAYEVAMSEGSDEANLAKEDFPGNEVNAYQLPEITLETIVYVDAGQKWMAQDADGQNVVTERWTWTGPGKPTRQGFNVEMQSWDNESVPWGAANIANNRRPKPHRVDAFADPGEQADKIIKLLQSAIEERLKNAEEGKVSHYEKLRQEIFNIRAQVLEESKAEVQSVETDVSNLLHEVFPGTASNLTLTLKPNRTS